MHCFKILIATVFAFASLTATAQKLEILHEGSSTSLRGLSINKHSIWVSGSNGTVGVSNNDGNNWKWITVPHFEKTDFRDVEALSTSNAVIMGIASPAYILKTTDGGNTWNKCYENKDTAMFLDAMAFDTRGGCVIGDAVHHHFFTAKTMNGGDNWQTFTTLKLPEAQPGEAFFAASGTNIFISGKKYYIVSGGNVSRFFSNNTVQVLPIMQGKQTTGANSIAVYKNTIAIAGGDFENPARNDSVFTYSNNNGKTWNQPQQPPSGYRSCVCFISEKTLIVCGINGVDISQDGGKTFRNISREGFNSCAFSPKANAVFLVGNKGKIAKISFR